MLLATAICFGFVIKMCTGATASSPDHFDDVFVCVEKDRMQNVTTVTWTIAAYIHATCCDLVYFEKDTSELSIEQNLSPSGTFDLTNLKRSVHYVVQVMCFVSSCNGPDRNSKTSKSSEVEFISGSQVSKVCSKTQPPYLSNGQIVVCIQETQDMHRVVQWWSSQPFSPTSCILHYTSFDAMDSQHRTETFRDLPMNNTMFLPVGGAADTWMECKDSNNEKQSSGMVRYSQDSMQKRVCSSVEVHTTSPNIAKNLPTVPTHYTGLHVSSLVQGLVLAFSMLVVALIVSLLAYKRYKSFMRRRAQRLLRIETEDETNEEAAMHEFQRMV